MKAVICWAGMQGYVAACLRELNKDPGLDLHVLHLNFQDLPFQEELLHGVSNQRIRANPPDADIPAIVEAHQPDVVFLCGWFYRPYRQLVNRPNLRDAKFVLGMDTSWTGSWQQKLNRLRLRGFMRRMARVVVAGAKSADFARRLDVPEEKILIGLYGFDFSGFERAGEAQLDHGESWPRRFLFAGRYAPEKGLDVLIDAYGRYRSAVSDPWPLHCCGTGPDAGLLNGEGVTNLGYIQPSGLPRLFADHGVFIMPSREEPWGVAIAEAAATGLPLICTDVCGAAADLLRPDHNGLIVPSGDAAALADAMRWMHEHHGELRAFGARSRVMAQRYSAQAWAARMSACFREVLGSAPVGT
jgi:glycosyltransferase involved in cell wall biosynthesis